MKKKQSQFTINCKNWRGNLFWTSLGQTGMKWDYRRIKNNWASTLRKLLSQKYSLLPNVPLIFPVSQTHSVPIRIWNRLDQSFWESSAKDVQISQEGTGEEMLINELWCHPPTQQLQSTALSQRAPKGSNILSAGRAGRDPNISTTAAPSAHCPSLQRPALIHGTINNHQ